MNQCSHNPSSGEEKDNTIESPWASGKNKMANLSHQKSNILSDLQHSRAPCGHQLRVCTLPSLNKSSLWSSLILCHIEKKKQLSREKGKRNPTSSFIFLKDWLYKIIGFWINKAWYPKRHSVTLLGNSQTLKKSQMGILADTWYIHKYKAWNFNFIVSGQMHKGKTKL